MFVVLRKIGIVLPLLFGLALVFASCGGVETTTPTTAQVPTTSTMLSLTTAPNTTEPTITEAEVPLNCTAEIVRCGLFDFANSPSQISTFTDIESYDAFESRYIIPYHLENQIKTEYNITFFKSYGVAVIYMSATSGVDRPYLDFVTQNKNTDVLTIKIGINTLAEVTDDMEGWFILVSFPKEDGFYGTVLGTVEFLPKTVLDFDDYYARYPAEHETN